MLKEADIIKGCKEFNSSAQTALYHSFAPKMKALCRRYSSSDEEAKDIMQEGFIKVYSNIKSYSGNGSFEGWIKRIMINTSISYYKKNKKYSFIDDTQFDKDVAEEDCEQEISLYSEYSSEDLMKAISSLPEPYRLVFNLFCLESHSHEEIGALLSIDEKTSRTRLFRSKKILKEYLIKLSEQRIYHSSSIVK